MNSAPIEYNPDPLVFQKQNPAIQPVATRQTDFNSSVQYFGERFNANTEFYNYFNNQYGQDGYTVNADGSVTVGDTTYALQDDNTVNVTVSKTTAGGSQLDLNFTTDLESMKNGGPFEIQGNGTLVNGEEGTTHVFTFGEGSTYDPQSGEISFNGTVVKTDSDQPEEMLIINVSDGTLNLNQDTLDLNGTYVILGPSPSQGVVTAGPNGTILTPYPSE